MSKRISGKFRITYTENRVVPPTGGVNGANGNLNFNIAMGSSLTYRGITVNKEVKKNKR